MSAPSATGPGPAVLDSAGVRLSAAPGRREYWCSTAGRARALALRRARSLGPGWVVDHIGGPRPHYDVVRVVRQPDGRTTYRRVAARFTYGGRRPQRLPGGDHGAAHRRGLTAAGRGPGLRPEWALDPAGADTAWAAAEYEREHVGPAPAPSRQLQTALRQRRWPQAIQAAVALGTGDVNTLTDMIFFERHPERRGTRIARHETSLAQEWLRIRDGIVRPALRTPPPGGAPAGPLAAPRDDAWLRRAWAEHLGGKAEPVMSIRMFGLRRPTQVNPVTVAAWQALEHALTANGYRASRAENFCVRRVTGGKGWSLHSYGIATDIDPECNPYRKTPRQPEVRWSRAPTQERRCAEVRAERADTSFTPAQIDAVEAISTVDGLQVITWGGRWRSVKDAMHFQINVSPEELRRGLLPN